MKKLYYMIAFSFILIGIIGAIFTGKDFFTKEFISGHELYDTENIEAIDVHSDVANIRILPTDQEEIKVEWSGKLFNSSQANVNVEQHGATLQIDTGNDRLFGLSQISFGFNFNLLEIDIYLPKKQLESIYVKTNVGSAFLSSIQVHDLTVHSDVANITLTDIGADSIEATSSVGAIKVENSTGFLDATSDVGKIDVKVDEITNDMKLHTEVGSIKVNVATIPANVTFSGSSELGSVNIFGNKGNYIYKDSDYIVTMETEVGSIKVTATD